MKEWFITITYFLKQVILSLKNLIFLKRFGTLHDLLIDLLNEKISTDKAVKEEDEMIKK